VQSTLHVHVLATAHWVWKHPYIFFPCLKFTVISQSVKIIFHCVNLSCLFTGVGKHFWSFDVSGQTCSPLPAYVHVVFTQNGDHVFVLPDKGLKNVFVNLPQIFRSLCRLATCWRGLVLQEDAFLKQSHIKSTCHNFMSF
jgi:hypothetical protein